MLQRVATGWLFLLSTIGRAETVEIDLTWLEIQLADPLAQISLVPLQYNFYMKDDDALQSIYNFQPVISGESENLVFINRFTMPYITSQVPTTDDGVSSVSGIGDFNYQLYITPKSTDNFRLGAGVLISMPTGVDPILSSGKWGAGITASIIHWTESLSYGALLYQNWSVAGNNARKDVNLLTIQPIFNWRLGGFWSLSFFNNITYDETLNGEQWTVPLGLQVNKLLPRPAVPLYLSMGAFSNVVHPDNGPEWSMKMQMTLIL